MLVRRLVSGVRSSWPASATSCRCRSRDAASADVIRLNDRLSRAISSAPCAGIRVPRSSVRAMCSTASVSSSTGRSDARAIIRPAPADTSTPNAATAISISARSLSGRSTWSSRIAYDSATRVPSSVSAGRVRIRTPVLSPPDVTPDPLWTACAARPAATSRSARATVSAPASGTVQRVPSAFTICTMSYGPGKRNVDPDSLGAGEHTATSRVRSTAIRPPRPGSPARPGGPPPSTPSLRSSSR
jgi:hypothetical protein